ncbi:MULTISPECIES: hypothetical protein [unclassified Mucilaginibacter]|uniref:hypothetical protein n=1 Tax=unclassified Mucilaginibacter TaxID=2617802 RepID=UPI0031F69D03
MKKLLSNLNPFILLMLPVLFALVLGVGYQFEHAKSLNGDNSIASVKQTTSLFTKGVRLVKVVCAVSTEKAW